MGQFSRTFRIFVSSTFSDLVAERNALQLRVFPRLRELCQQHGCRFQAIDLRWGVSEEASLDQQTMNICLGEISRCQKTTPKPNFIVLLGNRYGWRPLPSEISAKEFVHISSSVSSEDNQMLERWYRRDENSVPPTYSLQSRAGDYDNHKNWEKVENHLHAILETAARQLDLDPDELLKYTTSATEQEIMMGALRVADAQDHVFCYFREIEDLPQHECTANYIDLDSAGKFDDNASHLLVELKDRLKTYLPLNTRTYKAKWIDNSPSTEHLEQLCEDVYRDLAKIVLDEIAQLEKVNQLDREIAAHADFCQERVRHFFGRVNALKSIADHLKSGDHYSQVVWGESGCGKSALMAQAALQTRQTWPNAILIFRFIGATPESSNGRALLASLCHQISQAYGADESSIPFEYKKLVEEFPKRLALATKTKPLILFIDALDQLSSTDNAHNLSWLPVQMPANVMVVLSTLPGEGLQVLKGKLPGRKIIEMTALSAAEGQAILHAWLKETNRALRPVQKQYFLACFSQCGLPLYLKLAFEEARHWKSYDVNTSLPADIHGMIRKLFARLSQESNHGEMLVEHSLGYLATAKNGLSEDELLDILSMDKEIISDFLRRSPKSPKVEHLPVVIWSRLYFDLEPYLADREADGSILFCFYHRQLTEVVEEEYLSDDRKFIRHRSLAQYFQQQELFLQKSDNPVYNLRKLSELPYNQAWSGSGEALSKTLSEYIFIEAKVNGIGIQSLIDDYDLAYTSQAKVNPETQKRLGVLQRTMRLSAHVLAGDPRQLPSQLTGRLLGISKSHVKTLLEDARLEVTWPWLRPLNVSLETPGSALFRTFSIHSDEVNDVALTPDGHMAISAAGKTLVVWDVTEGKELHTLSGLTDKVDAVALTPDGQIAISASGKTLVVWDVTEGKQLRTLSGHTDKVNEVALTADGRLAVSASKDKTLRVWDLENGICLRTLAKHEKSVNTVALTPDGKLAISGSDDETLKVWRVASGKVLRTLVTPKKHGVYTEPRPVTTVALTPDGRLAVSGSKFKSIKVWDVATGVELHSLVGNAEFITDVALTHDGRLAVSASKDGTLTVWDVVRGERLSNLSGHNDEVNAVALTADGHLAVSASKDKSIKVWVTSDERSEELRNGIKLTTLAGHTDKVEAVAFTSDGTLAISGSSDTNLKVWDVRGKKLLHTLTGHNGEIHAVAFTPDGHLAISGSSDTTLKVWDVASGKELRTLTGHSNQVQSVAVTPDGQLAISGSMDTTLKVWDVTRGKMLHNLTGHKLGVLAVALTPDGCLAVSGSVDKTIKVWDITTGKEMRTITGHHSIVNSVTLTLNGHLAVSASSDKELKVWDVVSGRELRTLVGHANSVLGVALTPDGRMAVSASSDKELKLWDVESGRELHTLVGHADSVLGVAVTPDGRMVISGSSDKTLKVWDTSKAINLLGEGRTELRTLPRHDDQVTTLEVTPDCNLAVSASSDWTIKVWDVKNGALLHTFTDQPKITAIAITPNSSLAATAYQNGMLKILDITSGKVLRTLAGHKNSICDMSLSTDGRFIISISSDIQDHTLKVWDIKTGKLMRTLQSVKGPPHYFETVALSPDGRLAVSGSINKFDTSLKVWDITNGKELHTLIGHTDIITEVKLTPAGKTAISASKDKTLKVWDVASGKELYTLLSQTFIVDKVIISPDGRHAVSASTGKWHADSTLRVWDVASGRDLHILAGHTNVISAVAFTPDGRLVVSTSLDKTLKVWDVASGSTLATYTSDSGEFQSIAVVPNGSIIVAGDRGGGMHFLKMEGFSPGSSIVTAWRTPRSLIQQTLHRPANSPVFGCPACRTWSQVPEMGLGTELPCPQCGVLLRINPFVIESDWKRVADSWTEKNN